MQDRDPLDRLCGNGDQSAVGAEELVYLLGHNLRISLAEQRLIHLYVSLDH